MHEPVTSRVAFGGGASRQVVQAASLFGLEKCGDDIERIQGYSAGRINVSADRTFTCWPRRLLSIGGGDIKLAPDQFHDLDEMTSSFTFSYTVSRSVRSQEAGADERSVAIIDGALSKSFDLTRIKKQLVFEKAQRKVRRIEQEAIAEALKERRIGWLSFDWGMREDAFIAVLEERLVGAGVAYVIDFSEYEGREEFLSGIQNGLGASFQQICDAISDLGPVLVLFSGVDLASEDDDSPGRQKDIEGLAQAFSDFAPNAIVLILGPRLPRSSVYGRSTLKALDEADLSVYVKDSDLGGGDVSADAVAQIMRHTDGVPSRIDLAIRDLEVGSLQDLLPSNPDLSPIGGGTVAAPPALVATISELKSSGEREEQRSHSLLMALSALPQGERISRLKRFFGPNPIRLNHASELLRRSLIQARPSALSADGDYSESEKILFIPKLVRDYIRNNIDVAEARRIDRRALELYFGDSWSSGDISSSHAARQVIDPLCGGYEIQNMSTIIFRFISGALINEDDHELDSGVRLGISFVAMLMNGDHFRFASALCEDLLSLLSDVDRCSADVNLINCKYAECLRMTGNSERAIKVFERVDRSKLSKTARQSVELDMAYCYQRLKQYDDARRLAEELIPLRPKSAWANHARAILADLLDDTDERISTLNQVLNDAVKAGHTTVANNIRLDIASELDDMEDSRDMLREALSSAKKSDSYSRACIIVNLARLPDADLWLTPKERALLVDAYYYIYNERFLSLLGKCHDALWKIFEKSGDYANMLNLFRHSSFVWRISGKESKELKYLEELASSAHMIVTGNVSSVDRNGAYLIVRIAAVLGARD